MRCIRETGEKQEPNRKCEKIFCRKQNKRSFLNNVLQRFDEGQRNNRQQNSSPPNNEENLVENSVDTHTSAGGEGFPIQQNEGNPCTLTNLTNTFGHI